MDELVEKYNNHFTVAYYNGKISKFIELWSKGKPVVAIEKSNGYYIKDYVCGKTYKTKDEKLAVKTFISIADREVEK